MQTLSLRWRTWMAGRTQVDLPRSEPPLRAELFSVEQLARHAKALRIIRWSRGTVPTVCSLSWAGTMTH